MRRPLLFAYTAAALLVLVGFSAAAGEPLAVTGPATPETESSSESVPGGNGLTATEVSGGEFPGSIPEILIEITVAGDSVTLTAILAMDVPGGLLLVEITTTAEFYAYDALGNVRVMTVALTPAP